MMPLPPPPNRQQSLSGTTPALNYLENGNPLVGVAPLIPQPVAAAHSQSVQMAAVPVPPPPPSKSSHESEDDNVSVSSESDADMGKDDSDNEEEEEYVQENVSSKISNRSSPSVLSATIHQWPGYEEESHGLLDNNNEESSEENSEDNNDDHPDDPWKISPEQRGWYLSLFLRLQPDVRGFIEGKDARVFFENSQLPLHDLGEIWNYSDVDRDGRLSLAEFCYAMHLSVARRHNLTLPTQLPSSLKNSTRHILKAADAGSGTGEASVFSSGDYTHKPEWTKFSESPRSRGGPVQFRSTVDVDNKVAHPTAVKATPKSPATTITSNHAGLAAASAVRDGRSFSTGTVSNAHANSVHPPTTVSTAASTFSHPQDPSSTMAPPPPPPRSFHSRSASLDLQGGQLNSGLPNVGGGMPAKSSANASATAPQLPPRSSPITSKQLDSGSSESDSEARLVTHLPQTADEQPKKPPRVTKTPNKNVSFAPSGQPGDRPQMAAFFTSSLPMILDTSDLTLPSFTDIERMKSGEIWHAVERLKVMTEALSRQNTDLQQQLTDVVLKKRTAELHLTTQLQREKNAPHAK